MIDRFFRLAAFRPGWVLAAVSLVSLGFVTALVDFRTPALRLQIHTEIEKALPEKGPYPEFYEHFRERFGSDEIVFVGLTGAEVFSSEGLTRVRRLTRRLEKIDGVRRVSSLSNAPGIRSEDGDLRVANAYDEIPQDEALLAKIRDRILTDPMYAGNLVSEDGRATALLVYPEEMSEREFRDRGIDREIERVAREVVGDEARVLLAGNALLKAETGRILQRDTERLIPLSFVFMAFIAFYSFRSLRGVVVPLSCIATAMIWTTGTIVLVGRSLNLATFVVPILINALGFAYSVHVVSEHDNELRSGRDGPEAAYRALKQVAFPVFLTALTTAAGFLSLCLSRLPVIREFGAFCVVGVTASLVAALALAPALLALTRRRPARAPAAAQGSRIERVALGFADFDLRHGRRILAAGAVVTGLAIFGVTQIVVSTSFVTNLAPSNPLRVSSQAFDEELGGSTTFHVVVETGTSKAFNQPENLKELRTLQQWLDAQPEVSKTTSLADYLMGLNRAFHGGDEARFAIPETSRAITQFLFFFWYDGLKDLATKRYEAAHILVRAPAVSSSGINRFIDRVEERLAELPEPFVGNVTGDTVLVGRTVDEVAWGQAVSLSSAILIIYVIMLFYFRSAWIAFLALIPNTLPVTVYFGVLGLSGVTLNIITSMVACVVLGIAIDDTIHFLVRYREKARDLSDESSAVKAALLSVARPVTSTTAALSAGFMVSAASGLKHQVEFAVLSSTMLAFAWLVDMTLTPVLCHRLGVGASRQAAAGATGEAEHGAA